MNKNLLLFLLGVFFVILIGSLIVFNKKSPTQKQITNLWQTEKKIAKDLGLKKNKANVPPYKKAKVDEEKCGKDAFYIEEKSVDFVKNYCRFLRKNGWKLVHQDYSDCEDISSFGGGYNYEKSGEKIALSVIRYGTEATCFWVFKK